MPAEIVALVAARPVQDPDAHVGTPWYVTAAALVVLACMAVLVAIVVRGWHADRRQRARHALDRSHRQARLAEIVRTAPPLSLVPAADATPAGVDLDAPTRVIPLPPVKTRGGRHAAPSSLAGRARIYTTAAGRRFAAAVRHDGGPRA